MPNDVVAPPAGGRSASLGPKVAGILTEVVTAESERDDATVIGIGVNVRTRAFPPALAGRAAALESLAGRRVAGFALCADLLVRLARWRRRWQRRETPSSSRAGGRWRRAAGVRRCRGTRVEPAGAG